MINKNPKNPCPCGYLGSPKQNCSCTPTQIQRYRARVSGPLLDRIDIHVEAPALSIGELRAAAPGEPSHEIRQRVEAAREIQSQRFANYPQNANTDMTQKDLGRHCKITPEMGDILQQAMEKLSLSARAYDRILKVSRTIADLAASESIQLQHITEAIQYRSLDRTTKL